MSEEMKVPEDLREEYVELKHCAPRDGINHYMRRCEQLIERIAVAEADLALRTKELAAMTQMHANALKEAGIYRAQVEAMKKGALILFESHCLGAGHGENRMCPVCRGYYESRARASENSSGEARP